MWHPNQLLNDEIVVTLRQCGFTETVIEFLGWLSYNAAAINNSRNPCKAAHTILARPKVEKMVDAFMAKKKQSVRPTNTEEHDKVDRKFTQFEKWAEQVEAEGRPHTPSHQDKEDNE